MGRYIQGPILGKADMLVKKHGAQVIDESEAVQVFRDGKGVVCVVNNGPFDAAAYGYSESEVAAFFSTAHDRRPRTWLVLDKATAEELAE